MTKFLTAFLLVLLFAPLAAQVQLTNAYFPVAGDTLRSNTADSLSTATVDVGTAGADQAWGFGSPTVDNERSEPVTDVTGNTSFPNATVQVRTTAVTQSFYEVSATEFNLVGINTSLALLPSFAISTAVTPARAVRSAPLSYLDVSTSTTSNSITVSPDSIPAEALELIGDALSSVDSLRITTESTRESIIDAYGVASLEGNFYNVLREKQEESIFIRLEVKTGFLPFIDVTGTIVVISPDLARFIGQQDVTTTYLFWNPESKEPIAEIATSTETGVPFNFNFKRAQQSTSTRGPNVSRASLRVFPNPATDWATFEMSDLDAGEYTLSLMNTLGRVIQKRQFSPVGKQAALRLDVSHLPAGMYLYSLRNERGRVMATKKLLVR